MIGRVKSVEPVGQRAPVATRSYGGLSADERRAARREALIEAALDLVVEGGGGAVSKRSVCVRARLNDRYFYEHFADSDALLATVAGDLTARGLKAVGVALKAAGPDLGSQLRAVAEAALEFISADPRRSQLLLNSPSSDVLYRARLDSTRTIAVALSASIRNTVGDAAAAQPDTEIAAYALVSGAMDIIAAWLSDTYRPSPERLADLVAALLMATADVSTVATKEGA